MVLESTVPRATRRPSLQAWILFGVMGPFLYVCGLWDYLDLLGLPYRPEDLGLGLGNLLQILSPGRVN